MSRGRHPIPEYPLWSINPYEPDKRTTCAHISILIKRNPDMTLRQLAVRLARGKHLPLEECLDVLSKMFERGHLGYFDDTYTFHKWVPSDKKGE